MPKTQKNRLLEMFRDNKLVLTLGQIMVTDLACEYRARMSELRADGYRIDFKRGSIPSKNTYTLVAETQKNGQMILI